MSVDVETRWRIQDFVFAEAALLDAWALDDWLALFTDDCVYEVAPTGVDDGHNLSTKKVLFLIGDNRERLEQRVIRMKKTTAHVEYPYSKTRHLYGNIQLLAADGDALRVGANFATYRTKHQVTTVYPGSMRYELVRDGASFKIRSKRVVLDLDALVPQGKVSIFL